MNIDDLKSDMIITGPFWPEPVRVNKVVKLGDHVRLIGAHVTTKNHVDQLLHLSDFDSIASSQVAVSSSVNPWHAFLALETMRYRFASLYDPLLAMNVSLVDPLPHQIEAVYGVVLKMPRIRFLLAHDPGAGKTIMAGLIIKELKMRKVVSRILVVVPGHLKDQWSRELREKFEEKFVVVNRDYMRAHYGENVWAKENQVITSLDFAKQEDIIASLESSDFDLIIVDEAHKMSAERYSNKTSKTDRYKLGETLSRTTQHFLFLTATPHKGSSENFRLLLDLLEPGFFADEELVRESIKNRDNPLFLRRMKEDMKDFEGKPLFVDRTVKTPDIEFGEEEIKLYNDVSSYVKDQYGKAQAMHDKQRRNIGFALVILQRRLASSVYSLQRSLERRKKRLEDMRDRGVVGVDGTSETFETDDMNEEERWELEKKWETLSVAENKVELEGEIATIKDLIVSAKDLINQESEVKLGNLKETMSNLWKDHPGKKILVFTESKDTLDYLMGKMEKWGYLANTIHGGMGLEERVEAERVFKNKTDVMVATEAAGEGINLQFCHLMINYDLPWNPNRLEQRMGRVHRYGQQYPVTVFNLIASNTREGEIFKKLFERLESIKRDVGDKVYDVVTEVLPGKKLAELLLAAAASAKKQSEILAELDFPIDEEEIRRIKENLGDSLATKYMDYTSISEIRERAHENKLIPEYTREFFKTAFREAGGTVKDKSTKGKGVKFMAVDSIPYVIKSIALEDQFKKCHGSILNSYPRITFDKTVGFENPEVEFVTFGHPLFEATMEWIERKLSDNSRIGAVFEDPDGRLDGHILFYEGEIKDGMGDVAGKKLFSYFVDTAGTTESVNPSILWDLAKPENPDAGSEGDLEGMKEHTMNGTILSMEKYQAELLEERKRQGEIKRKYGLESLSKLIIRLDNEITGIERQKKVTDKFDVSLWNKQEQRRKYESARSGLVEQIEKEQRLTMSTPEFFGMIRVVPQKREGSGRGMSNNPESEAAGMVTAMEYEVNAGRKPVDVSKENLGFDIKSSDNEGKTRYIEVKARSGVGDVILTTNEWFRAEMFKDDYYLYVVWNAAKSSPQLITIQNPATHLSAERREQVRYVIAQSQIKDINS